MEIARLWLPTGVSQERCVNVIQIIKSGTLSVPCYHFKMSNEDVREDIDSLLLDAATQSYPTLGLWDLNAQGRPYPADADKDHYLDLRERVEAREADVREVTRRVQDAEAEQFALYDEIQALCALASRLAIEEAERTCPFLYILTLEDHEALTSHSLLMISQREWSFRLLV